MQIDLVRIVSGNNRCKQCPDQKDNDKAPVPISYSERAVTAFPSAELVIIEGAGHGFSGEDDQYVTKRSVDFVKAHLDTAH